MSSEMEEIVNARLKLLLLDHQELLDIIQSYPKTVKAGTEDIYSYIEALKKALVTLPEEFDLSYSRKINQILDIAQELDKHTSTLENTLNREIPKLLKEQEERLENKCKPPYWMMFILGALGACFGSASVMVLIMFL